MGKNRVINAVLLTIIILTVLNCGGASGNWKTYYYRLRISLVNKGSSSYIPSLEDRLFLIFPNTSIQQAYIYEAEPDVTSILRDEDGNLFAELDFPETIGPGENITAKLIIMINVTFRSLPEISINSSGSFSDIPAWLVNYTVPSGAWRYDEEGLKYIADLAAQIKGNDTNTLRIISKMVEFIGNRVKYPEGEELRPPQYPNQTLPNTGEVGWGDCDDQSALLIAMLRSVGIPAYLQTGGVISPFYSVSGETWGGHLTMSSKGIGWHGWVEAYVPPWGWLPVDITYGHYYRPQDPLSSIKYSAPASELVLESEKYSTTDFVAESQEMEERIRSSSIYVYMEEEVSDIPFSKNDSPQTEQLEKIVRLLILLLAVLIGVGVVHVLLKQTGFFKELKQNANQDIAFDDYETAENNKRRIPDINNLQTHDNRFKLSYEAPFIVAGKENRVGKHTLDRGSPTRGNDVFQGNALHASLNNSFNNGYDGICSIQL